MGFVFSICDYSFALALSRFASAIGGLFSPSCIAGEIADDVSRPGSQPDCKVTAQTADGTGAVVDSVVPACDDNGGTPPCWSLLAGGPLCVGQVLQLTPMPRRLRRRSPTTAGCARRGSRSAAAGKISPSRCARRPGS